MIIILSLVTYKMEGSPACFFFGGGVFEHDFGNLSKTLHEIDKIFCSHGRGGVPFRSTRKTVNCKFDNMLINFRVSGLPLIFRKFCPCSGNPRSFHTIIFAFTVTDMKYR